jgi:hypothetical protein
MYRFKITWYDINEIKLVEYIDAVDEHDARNKSYMKYGGKNTPGPCILVEKAV